MLFRSPYLSTDQRAQLVGAATEYLRGVNDYRGFDEIEDPYLRERKADIQQVAERVLKVLMGSEPLLPKQAELEGDEFLAQMIVVAHDISPADMLKFRDRSFIGFVTDVGGQNSHTAIVARSLDIPAAVGMSQASTLIQQDDWVIIDGDAGVVIVT